MPLLKSAPTLMAITLLRKLQDDHPDRFPDGVLRTLQRHIRHWRALEGSPKEVFFPQDHPPGHRGLSDFTATDDLRITIAEAPFAHILYHFVLAFSRWEHVEVVEGGESFEALSKGLQNALWQAGGAPQEHRSDSLSAAFKNLAEEQDFTVRYTALLDYYGMAGTRNNRGVSHENGSRAAQPAPPRRIAIGRVQRLDSSWLLFYCAPAVRKNYYVSRTVPNLSAYRFNSPGLRGYPPAHHTAPKWYPLRSVPFLAMDTDIRIITTIFAVAKAQALGLSLKGPFLPD